MSLLLNVTNRGHLNASFSSYSSNSFSSALLTLLCVLSPSTEKRQYMITSTDPNDAVS